MKMKECPICGGTPVFVSPQDMDRDNCHNLLDYQIKCHCGLVYCIGKDAPWLFDAVSDMVITSWNEGRPKEAL